MRRRTMCAAAVLLCLVSTQALWGQADVLKVIPDDALAFVLVNNLGGTSAKVEKIAKQLQIPLPGQPLEMLKMHAGAQRGVDEKGSTAIVFLPPPSTPPRVVVLIPVTDYKAFLAQFPAKGTDGGITEVPSGGNPVLVAQKGSFAAVTGPEGKDGLKQLLASTKDISATVEPLKTWLAGNDASAVVTPKGLQLGMEFASRGIVEAKKAFENRPAPPELQQAAASLDMFAGMLTTIKNEVSQAAAGVRVDSAGAVHIASRTIFNPAGEFAKAAKSTQPLAGKPLTGLPGGAYVFAFSGSVSEETVAGLMEWSMSMRKSNPALANLTDEQAKKMTEISREMIKGVSRISMVSQSTTGDAPLYSGLIAVMQVEDAARFQAKYEKVCKEMSELMKGTKFPGAITEVKNVEVGPLKAIELTMDMSTAFPPGTPPQVQMILERMMGKATDFKAYVAGVDSKSVLTTYINKDNLTKAADAVKKPESSLAADAGIAKTTALLPTGAQMLGYLSPQGLVTEVKAIVGQFAPIPIPEFPASSPIGGALKISANGLETDVVIPSDVLDAAGAYSKKFSGSAQAPAVRQESGQLQLQPIPKK